MTNRCPTCGELNCPYDKLVPMEEWETVIVKVRKTCNNMPSNEIQYMGNVYVLKEKL